MSTKETPRLTKRQREILAALHCRGGDAVPSGNARAPYRRLRSLGLIEVGMAGGYSSRTYYRATLTAAGERAAAGLAVDDPGA